MKFFNAPLLPLTDHESAQMHSIRGASAIAVVIGHANQILIAPTFSNASFVLGLISQFAVMIFFVLSGFLIEKSISKNVMRNKGKFSSAEYFTDRAFRIMPALVFSSLLMYCLFILAPHVFQSGSHEYLPGSHQLARAGFNFDWREVYGSLVFMNGFYTITPDANGALWSLSIEVWYYIMASLIFILARRPVMLFAALILILLAGRHYQPFFFYLPVWFAGFFLSMAHNRGALKATNLLAAGAYLLGFISLTIAFFSYKNPGVITYFNISGGLFFACLLGLMLKGKLCFPKIFSGAAGYSYTLYIAHVPVLFFILGAVQNQLMNSPLHALGIAVASVVMVIMFAKLAAHIVENKATLKNLYCRFSLLFKAPV